MSYNYKEFVDKNNQNKSSGVIPLRIDYASFKQGICKLSNGYILKIDNLIENVLSGDVSVSNPSKLGYWIGFKSVKGFCVCESCLARIERHEGVQKTRKKDDWGYCGFCDMCEEAFDTLYEIV